MRHLYVVGVILAILFIIPTWVAYFTSDKTMQVYLNAASYTALAGLLYCLVMRDEIESTKCPKPAATA